MKKLILAAALSAVVFSPMSALAAEQVKPAGKSTPAKQEAPNVQEFDKQMAQVRENLKRMDEQMEAIRQAQDPQERQKLLQDHWTTMQNSMGMMNGMWWPGMMGCCGAGGAMMGGHMMDGHMMGWGGMGRYYSGLTPEQMKQRQYMMDQYMGMQQMMMDQMMQHQQYMWMK